MTRSDRTILSRRALLAGASAVAATAFVNPVARALARAPIQNNPAPGFYRFKVGGFEATIVSDGPLALGEPRADIFVGVSKDDFAKALTDNFLPTDNLLLEQNTLVVNTGDKLVLFDTGTGFAKAMGPYTGKLMANLKAAGIDPKDIDAIALTHAHPDHCWGLMTEAGARNFPNAQIYMTQSDLDFWTDESKAPNDMIKSFITGTRPQLLPNRDRMVFVKDGQEIVSGIQAMAAPGHTVGHTVYMVTSQGKTLCNAGDLAHHHVVSLERPRAQFLFDTDGQQAVASRVRMFDMLAAQRIPMVSYHFPWPGLGHVGKQGDGYRFFASPMLTTAL